MFSFYMSASCNNHTSIVAYITSLQPHLPVPKGKNIAGSVFFHKYSLIYVQTILKYFFQGILAVDLHFSEMIILSQ